MPKKFTNFLFIEDILGENISQARCGVGWRHITVVVWCLYPATHQLMNTKYNNVSGYLNLQLFSVTVYSCFADRRIHSIIFPSQTLIEAS